MTNYSSYKIDRRNSKENLVVSLELNAAPCIKQGEKTKALPIDIIGRFKKIVSVAFGTTQGTT